MSELVHLLDDYPDVDRRSCRLLGPTALVVQGLMGLLVISSLVLKRHRETPKRPWRIWLFDVSKQIIGQMFVHGVNVLISDVVAHVSSGNACVLYFLNILLDTTLGIGVIYLILHSANYFFTERCHLKGFESGNYGKPPSLNYWARQAAVYVFALTTMKLLVVGLFVAWPGIFEWGAWLLQFLGPSDAMQVIFVMGLFPIIMNVLQFWIIDSIVKSSKAAAVALPDDTPRASLDPDTEPLFRGSLDDDDDDGDLPIRHDIENPPPRSLGAEDSSQDLMENEPKSLSSGTTTIVGSGSATPTPKPSEASLPVAIHAYPPSNSTSPASSVSSRALSTSPKPRRLRRSPPPPLALHPRSPAPVAVNTPPVSTVVSRNMHKRNSTIQEIAQDEKDWAAWDDGADDWAERVGEEEWTGRRLEAMKGHIQNVWTAHTPEAAHPRS
ncbi:hypothetical protein OBBRIDRAFT_787754 [Obba rivulosa]|uniref:Vacuolar membrane protein n=1 Tax=Obba rivulosa TaxID=1052685 RepID=A0A8E2DUH8_9APHY|nr:hypothetical protein OBBRIDRAFT_787754 [Obba rivulosa]